jgi:hypothetical protein
LLLVVLGIGAWFYFGGSAEGPENLPDPNAPSADEAASGIAKFFDKIGSTISGWGELTWRIIAVFVLVAIGVWVFRKVPMLVWLVLALVGLVVAVLL